MKKKKNLFFKKKFIHSNFIFSHLSKKIILFIFIILMIFIF
jgi:hypothetical protein